MESSQPQKDDILFIIDEPERTYNSMQLWIDLLQPRVGNGRAQNTTYSLRMDAHSQVFHSMFPANHLAFVHGISLARAPDVYTPDIFFLY